MEMMTTGPLGVKLVGMPKICMRPAIVYEAVNRETGERYVGFTSRSLERRRRDHVRAALNGTCKAAFQRALVAYGVDGFTWRVIAEFESGEEAIREEQHTIKAERPAYNSTKGGQAYKPKVVSADERERLRVCGLARIEVFREYAHLGPAASARRVVCLDDGKAYESASAAAEVYGVCKSAVIEVCLRRDWRRSVGGLVFRYEGDHEGGKIEADRVRDVPRVDGKNPYKGVYRHVSEGKDTGRFRARIAVGGRGFVKKHSLGIFDTAEQARDAYLAAKQAVAEGKFPHGE